MQERTNFSREAGVAAASVKNFEYVQPPSETTTFRWGCLALSFLIWLKLPRSFSQPVSATPSTDCEAAKGRA